MGGGGGGGGGVLKFRVDRRITTAVLPVDVDLSRENFQSYGINYDNNCYKNIPGFPSGKGY